VPQRTFSSCAAEKGLTGSNASATADGDGIPNGIDPSHYDTNPTRLGTMVAGGKKYLTLSYTNGRNMSHPGLFTRPSARLSWHRLMVGRLG
jgi:hypothetical protein